MSLCQSLGLVSSHPHPRQAMFSQPHHPTTPSGSRPLKLKARRAQRGSPSEGANRQVGPRPRQWGY
eukprot:3232362-Pyramimonas_sp.AAC.1